jgi:two-component system chemotaxis response regulator CheY
LIKTECKVLVVHEDQDLREVLANLLAEKGFPTAQAENGHAALTKMRSGYRPDVIISDLLMPVMDGYQLKTELKRHPKWAKIPLLILAGGDVGDDALAGIEAVVQTPIDLDDLLERVREACKHKAAAG